MYKLYIHIYTIFLYVSIYMYTYTLLIYYKHCMIFIYTVRNTGTYTCVYKHYTYKYKVYMSRCFGSTSERGHSCSRARTAVAEGLRGRI